jgi:hypothetical protein
MKINKIQSLPPKNSPQVLTSAVIGVLSKLKNLSKINDSKSILEIYLLGK